MEINKDTIANWSQDRKKIYEIYTRHQNDIDSPLKAEFEQLLTNWLDESKIKIISWNCNGKFREKFKSIIEEQADIYVIQECEDPSQTKDEDYIEFAGENYFWTGNLHYKGLGIFAGEDIKLEKLDYDNEDLNNFLAVRVNDSFNLLGVWAMPDYVEMIHDYFDEFEELFNDNLIMCGDFNSNVIWDNQHKDKNHTELNKKLKNNNLVSVYHNLNDEELGMEKSATFYQTRHLNQPFHIDYVYAGESAVEKLDILDQYKWITLSDHLPLMFEIEKE